MQFCKYKIFTQQWAVFTADQWVTPLQQWQLNSVVKEALQRERETSCHVDVFLQYSVVYILALLPTVVSSAGFCWQVVKISPWGQAMEAAVFEYHKTEDTVDIKSFQGTVCFAFSKLLIIILL